MLGLPMLVADLVPNWAREFAVTAHSAQGDTLSLAFLMSVFHILLTVLCQTFIKMGLLSSFTCSDEFSSLRLSSLSRI